MTKQPKMSPPPEARANFGRAIAPLAAEIAKLPKELFQKDGKKPAEKEAVNK